MKKHGYLRFLQLASKMHPLWKRDGRLGRARH